MTKMQELDFDLVVEDDEVSIDVEEVIDFEGDMEAWLFAGDRQRMLQKGKVYDGPQS